MLESVSILAPGIGVDLADEDHGADPSLDIQAS
jgi:hypothetical protein